MKVHKEDLTRCNLQLTNLKHKEHRDRKRWIIQTVNIRRREYQIKTSRQSYD